MSSCIFQLSIFFYALFSDLEQQLQALPAVAIQNIQVYKLFAITQAFNFVYAIFYIECFTVVVYRYF